MPERTSSPLDTAYDLLHRLREEVRDWQEALCGERDGLDELCAEVDKFLKT